MNWQKILLPVAGAVLIVVSFQAYGWAGAALAVSAVVMFLLLQFNQMVNVLKRTAVRPKGYVGSAVMLNARLKPGVNLLHVMAMTNSLGELVSPEGEEPEVYRWTDDSDSHVSCEFTNGKLVKWTLYRPPSPEEAAPPAHPKIEGSNEPDSKGPI